MMKKVKQPVVKKMTTRLKHGDEVVVLAGRDKGKRGTIKQVMRGAKSVKLKVTGVNMLKKHVKPNPQANEQGGIVSMEGLIDASNVMIFDATKQKGARIGMKTLKDGKKVRCFKADGALTEIEV